MSKYSEENLSRIGNAAIYIAEHTSDLSKTKLLKLLYLMEERSACDILSHHLPGKTQSNLSFIAGTTDFASKTGNILVKPRYVDTNDLGILEAHKIETLNERINNSLLYCK